MIIMAVCALAVVALVVWALTRTVDPTTAESPQAAAFPTAEPPAAIPTTPTATTAQTSADPTATSADIHPETGVPRISDEDFRPKYDAGSVVVIDVRDANSYAVGHIPGAMNIPMASIQSFTDMIPKGKEIVTYCT